MSNEQIKAVAKKNYREEIKSGIDLVKFLLKNEHDERLKKRLAELGGTLNELIFK